MECEHRGGGGMSECSMACCHDGSQILATTAIFVMPEPATICLPSLATTAPSNFAATESVPSFAPPSPPPRTLLCSL
jgi:hypothetical protein